MQIDNEKRLISDLEIICYQGSHKIFALIINIIFIILWGLGIPALGAFLLINNRENIKDIEVR
jgi:hypothetical protein